jgi:hypothetical protein
MIIISLDISDRGALDKHVMSSDMISQEKVLVHSGYTGFKRSLLMGVSEATTTHKPTASQTNEEGFFVGGVEHSARHKVETL